MPYEVIAHTAGMRLKVRAQDPEDLFREALRGMTSVLKTDTKHLPASVAPAGYNEVWVWCRSFAVPFGKAILK